MDTSHGDRLMHCRLQLTRRLLWALILTPSLLLAGVAPESDADDVALVVRNLQSLDLPKAASDLLPGLAGRAEDGTLSQNDRNLICIGALTGVYAVSFGIGVVPNPPWDYSLGQVPAWASNLGLKYCPAVLEAPNDLGVFPNVDTTDGANCAYDFSQPVIAGERSDFMGFPLRSLGSWTFTESATSIGLGTPSVFHYNTGVQVRMLLPGESPFGYASEAPDDQFVAEVGPFGIRAPDLTPFSDIGCLVSGLVPFATDGTACPIDLERQIRLDVGTHEIVYRAETDIGLLDTLPPIYVPGQPPGSKKELAKQILKNVYEAARDSVTGEFLESYPSGVVTLDRQEVLVYDITDPSLGFTNPQFALYAIEAQEPGGQSTRGLRPVLESTLLASDACNRTPRITAGIPPFLPLGDHVITWTASDQGPVPGGGVNSTTLDQIIRIEDTRAPEIAAPPPVVVESDVAPTSVDIGSPQVFDVVDLEPVIEFDGPSEFEFGLTVVRWRAIDGSGNASAWVDQPVRVKPTGTNNAPVANVATAQGISFEETIVELVGSDIDNDDLFFYIDEQPEEGFFVAPLLPTFVDDLRVEAQIDASAICLGGGTLPVQDYVYDPIYVTTNDDSVTFVLDKRVQCNSDGSGTGLDTNEVRLARFGPDGALQAETFLGNQTNASPRTLSFHPGGLPGYPDPFIYWVSRGTQRLITIPADLTGGIEVIRVDSLPSGTPIQSSLIDAAIDPFGLVHVTDTRKIYVFDFLTRDSDGNNAALFLDRLGRPVAQTQGDFGQAWDMDVDAFGNIYVSDFSRHQIHKFGPSSIDRDIGPSSFVSGSYIGWNGRCTVDTAPGDAAVCDTVRQRSLGYSCTDAFCGSPAVGDAPGQFRNPQGFAIDPNGILYIADRGNNRIQRFTEEGLFAGQSQSDCSGVNCFVIGDFGVAETVTVNSTSFFVLDNNTEILHIFSANPVTMTSSTTAEVTYRSENNFIGVDSFEYFASDGLRIDGELVRSNTATAFVQIEENSRPPQATPGLSALGNEDQTLPILLDGSDPDIGDTYPWEPLQDLSFTIATPPNNGQITLIDGVANYQPDPDFNGTDGFSFTVSDGIFTSAPETVAIEILPVNDAPQLTAPTEQNELTAGLGFEHDLVIGLFDPDEEDSHNLSLNWGDGTIESEGEILSDGTITGPLIDINRGGDGQINGSHLYGQSSTRTVFAEITDSQGGLGTASFDVQVIPMTDLNVFEVSGMEEAQQGQPIVFGIAVSNLAPEVTAGIAATNVELVVELDPRLTVFSINGASCSNSAGILNCPLPNLNPINRGPEGGLAPIDRLITITTLPPPDLALGTRLISEARLSAGEPNRNDINAVTLERFIVANADFVVSSNPNDSADANPGDGLCADASGRCSLRAAVEEANALGSTRRVAVSSGLFRQELGEIEVFADIELVGLGVGQSELIAVGANRLFSVSGGGSLSLSGLTLSGDQEVAGTGGLITNAGNLLIEDALLQLGSSFAGGAISNEGQLTLRRTALMNNSATNGGALGGALFNTGGAELENVLLYDNLANAGGAIHSTPASGATISIAYSTISANRSLSVGAAFSGDFSDQVMATLSNSIVSGNVAQNPSTTCWNQL
ncbi:MAG: Ig-like domain-containing protein, partial [Pseudomonadota bacterium]